MTSDDSITIPGASMQGSPLPPTGAGRLERDAGDKAIEVQTATAKTLDPRPRIKLPGDDRLISDFASDAAQVLAANNFYDFGGVVAVYEGKRKTLSPISPAAFRSYSERHFLPIEREGKRRSRPIH